MAFTQTDADIVDNGNPVSQSVSLGSEVKANQDNISANAADIALIQAGQSIVLPTEDPGVAGQLWANECIVTVSSG